MVGIPMVFVLLTAIGEKLNNFNRKFDPFLLRLVPMVNHLQKIRFLVTFIGGVVFVVFVPSLVLSKIQTWTLTDSMYFTFITLTTIGFGDISPGRVNVHRYLNELLFMNTSYRKKKLLNNSTGFFRCKKNIKIM